LASLRTLKSDIEHALTRHITRFLLELGEAARLLRAKRDDRRSCDAPSRTHRGEQVRAKKALEGLKKQRALSIADINEAILEVSAKAMRERQAAAPPQPRNPNASKSNIRAKRDICI